MRSLLLLPFLALAPQALASQEPASERPNVLLFLVDDLGWQDVSVPFWKERTPFNDHFRTPHLARLASQGVVFTDGYAAAVCSPTRTSIMTGQNPARHRVTNWTLYADRDQSGKTERLRAPSGWRTEGLQPGDVTLASLLRDSGYYTIHAGKAHWGADGTAGEDCRNLGFVENHSGHCAGAPKSYHGEAAFGKGQGIWAVPGLEAYHGLPVHLTDALTIESSKALERAVASGRPFYLYRAPYAVHTPIEEHAAYVQKYRDAGFDEKEARYASMVEGVDASLGALLAQLERLGVAEETIVVFTSDNGGLSAHARGTTPRGTGANTHCWPLKAGKGSAYEGGTRVPWVAAWAKPNPQHPLQERFPIAQGERCATPVIVEDLFPTILGWAGVESPDGHVVDGRSFRSALASPDEGAGEPRPLVFHYPHVWGPAGPGYEPHSSMRLGPWKVIWFYQPKRWELYHLVDDIGETRDLAAARPEVLREMASRLVSILEARGALYPEHRESGEPEPPVAP